MHPLLAIALLSGCRTSFESSGNPRVASRTWEAMLGHVVTEDGLVDYDAIEADREPLDDFVAWIARGDAMRGKKKADHHAFWLNAYNALVIFQVLERGRPASVLDVDGWIPLPGSGFFVETQFQVGDDWLSLSEIEHERVRMKELNYRDHAALNCASMGCPPLLDELYVKPKLRDQLTSQMERWVNDPVRGVRVEDGVAVFSPIFDWYAFDFEFTSAGDDPCTIAASHAREPLHTQLVDLAEAGCPRRFASYDWSLNDASGGAVRP